MITVALYLTSQCIDGEVGIGECVTLFDDELVGKDDCCGCGGVDDDGGFGGRGGHGCLRDFFYLVVTLGSRVVLSGCVVLLRGMTGVSCVVSASLVKIIPLFSRK